MSPVTLKEILHKELSILQDLLDLEEKTHKLLIEGGARELDVLNLQKENLLQEVNKLERERVNMVPAGTTLGEYIKENPFEAEALLVLKKLLLRVHTSLKRIQKINRYFLNFNLNYIKHSLSFFYSQGGEVLYAPSGEKQQNSLPRGILDSNA